MANSGGTHAITPKETAEISEALAQAALMAKAPVHILTPKEIKGLRKSLKGQGNINRLKRKSLRAAHKKGVRNA